MPVHTSQIDVQNLRTGQRLLLLGAGLLVLMAAAWYLRHALLTVYVSCVFAVVLKPAVDWVQRLSIFGRHTGRGTALLIIVLVLVAAITAVAIVVIPALVSDSRQFFSALPEKLDKLQALLQKVPILRDIDFRALPSRLSSSGGTAVRAARSFGGSVLDVFTTLLLIAYLILDGERLLKSILSLFPPDSRPRLETTLNRAAVRMRRWLTGQAILMVILGTSSGICFGLLGIPYFLLVAVFAGVANIIPLLGPLATVAVASLLAATESGWKVLGVLIFYLVYQQIENAFLTPNIMKSQVRLSSATVLIALLVAGELAGISGALVAVPSAVLIAEFAGEYSKR